METPPPYCIGIDLGGSSIKVVSVLPDGRTLSQKQDEFGAEAADSWARTIKHLVREVESERKASAQWIGLAAPGLAAANGASIVHMPGRLAGLEGLNWTAYLGRHRPIPVLNDAHAALLGERWKGAALGLKNVILLTLGTGVGGAILVNGTLLKGRFGRAGHLGHVCLNPKGLPDIARMPGSLEDAIGNCTVVSRTGGRFTTTHQLVFAHLAGDSEASRIWLKSVRELACAIASFGNILDPEAVVVGGGIARCGPALFEPLQMFLDEVEWRPGGARMTILPAQLGEFSGAYGAAWNAFEGAG